MFTPTRKKKHLYIIGITFLCAIALPIPALALSISVHVPEKYTDVQAGARIYFEINIKYPENLSRKDLRLNYEITKDDEIIAQAKFLKAVETQASFIDFIVIPESAKKGLHVIKVGISDYEDLDEEIEASFHVIKRGDTLKLYFFILLGAILFVGLLATIQIMLIRRKRNQK